MNDAITTPIEVSKPQAGFYKTRMVKGGPWVPARLYRADDQTNEFDLPVWYCKVPDRIIADTVAVLDMWPYLAKNPIDQATYDFMVADQEHAHQERPLDALATSGKSVDWIGHNQPPSDDLIKAERLIERAGKFASVATIDDAHDAINLVKQITILGKRLDEERKAAGAPHKTAQSAAMKPYVEPLEDMVGHKQVLTHEIHKWRIAADLQKVTTDLGATAFGRVTTKVVISDPDLVPRAYCVPDNRLVETALKAGIKVAGAELKDQISTIVS